MKLVILAALLILTVSCGNIYKDNKSAVISVTKQNWDSQVMSKRNIGHTLIIHFYKSSDGKSLKFRNTFNEEANKAQGIFQFCAIDCEADFALCAKEDVKQVPALKIYPPVPIPSPEPDFELDIKRAIRISSGYVQSKVQEVTDDNYQQKMGENPAVPKVLLFTDKPGVPILFKALSLSFDVGAA